LPVVATNTLVPRQDKLPSSLAVPDLTSFPPLPVLARATVVPAGSTQTYRVGVEVKNI
jgi:hypothetical protein